MPQLLALARDYGRIDMIDLDAGARRVVLTDTGPNPDGVVCDGETIYWTTMGQRTSTSGRGEAIYADRDGGVHAIDVDGENPRDVVAPGGTTTAKQLALDARGNLYWGNREGMSLATARTDGSGRRDLIKRDGSRGERDWIVGVAVDEDAGHIYWTQKGSHDGGDGQIFRAGLEIPAGETAENRTDVELLWDNLPAPIDLDLFEGHVLWTDRGAGDLPGGNSLSCAAIPPAGRKGEQPYVLADGFSEAIGLTVDAPQRTAYVADLSGQIWAVPNLGQEGEGKELITDLGFAVTGLNHVKNIR